MTALRISSVETFVLGERELLVRIGTEDGRVGWGDATLEHRTGTVAACVRELSGMLLGEDPMPVTALWQTLTRGGFYRGGAVLSSAVAGLDQALWDLRGHVLDAPIHVLLGGPCRERVRLYTHTWGGPGRTGDPVQATALVNRGYTLMKASIAGPVEFLWGVRADRPLIADLEALRAAIGPDVDFGIDLHGRVSLPHARRLAEAVAHTRPAFFEEPTRPEHQAHLARLTGFTSIPIGTGERLYSREEFLPVLRPASRSRSPTPRTPAASPKSCASPRSRSRSTCSSRRMPAGARRVCGVHPDRPGRAELLCPGARDRSHRPRVPDLALLRDPAVLVAVDGYLPRPTGPGLGIELDEDSVRARAREDLRVPVGSPRWRGADGGSPSGDRA